MFIHIFADGVCSCILELFVIVLLLLCVQFVGGELYGDGLECSSLFDEAGTFHPRPARVVGSASAAAAAPPVRRRHRLPRLLSRERT